MLTVKKDHAKPPAGGHRFPVGATFLKADTVDGVLSKMEDHRATNALPLDFPEKDLADYYLSVAPYLVKEIDGDWKKSRSQMQAEAIMSFWREHPTMLAATDAIIELRRPVCEACPLRQPFERDGESGRLYCTIARRRASLLCSDREFESKGLCSWSHLPVDLICHVKDPAATLPGLLPVPKPCWVKTL